MGKFKAIDIEQKEMLEEDIDFEQVMQEMYERNVLQGAAELCRRGDYGYAKFIDELQREMVKRIQNES